MNLPRLLITRRLPDSVHERLAAAFDVTVIGDDRPPDKTEMANALRSFDAICPTITDKLDSSAFSGSNYRTRIIANFGAGLEHIDLDAARPTGIVVTNTPDALTEATAELALLLMLMTARRAGEGERLLRAGAWTGWAPTQLLGLDLRGKTLGLVGFGRIGRETARRARAALHVRIAYYSRTRADHASEAAGGAQYHATLCSLLTSSDIVSLHCPGGAATRHLINAETLKYMKPTSMLINTARGSIVDESALAEALASRSIAAAGLDVYEHEPRVHEPLLKLDNVVLLPHLGSATLQARTAMGMQMADNLDAFFRGEEPPNRAI